MTSSQRDGERWTTDVCVLPEATLDLDLGQKHRERDGRGRGVQQKREGDVFLLNSDIIRDVSLEQK